MVRLYLKMKMPMEFLNFLMKMKIARVRPFPKKPITEHIPHKTAPAIHKLDIFVLYREQEYLFSHF